MNRERIVLLSYGGYDSYRHDDGTPFFPPAEFDVTLLARPPDLARVTRGQVTRGIPVDIHPYGELTASLPGLVRGLEVDWVVATHERLLLPAARLREALGVDGLHVHQTRLLRDKVAMKQHFSAGGIRVPEFIEISEPRDAADLLDRFGQIVIKPVHGSSSRNVHIIRDRGTLMGLQQRGLAGPDRYEAEEFVAGSQFHIDSVVGNGVPMAVSVSKYLDSHENFPMGGQVRSHTVDGGPELRRLLAFNSAVLAGIPWFSGAVHLEAFLDDRGDPVFCEVGGRPGGAGIDTTFRYRHGTSLLFASVLPQIGRAVPRPDETRPTNLPATGWSMIYPTTLGRFDRLEPPPSADWLLALTTQYRQGELVRRPRQATDAVAVASVHGRDSQEVTGRLAEVKSGLRVSTIPE